MLNVRKCVTPTADNFIYEGVTSVSTGNSAGSNLDIGAKFKTPDLLKTPINIASLVGHNTVRCDVIGDARRDPSADEQLRMQALVE